MSSMYWIGTTGTAVAQVDTFTPAGTITTGDVNTLTITDESGATSTITFTVGATTTAAAVVTGLTTAWNLSNAAKALATPSGTSTLILTAKVSGVPFHVASSVTGVGTLTRAATTANAGSSDWGTAGNWSGGAVPATSDNVTIDGRATAAIKYGLGQSGVTLANLNIDRACTQSIGTATAALRIGATAWKIGEPAADGSSASGTTLINLDFGSTVYTGQMIGSNSTGTNGLPTVNVKGSGSTNQILMSGGVLGVGTAQPGDTATTDIDCTGGKLTVGAGVTYSAIINTGGDVTIRAGSSSGTITNYSGNMTTEGTALIQTIKGYGGTLKINHRVSGSASVTNFDLYGAVADFTGNQAGVTMTNSNLRRGTMKLANPAQITFGTVTIDTDNRTQISIS